VATAVHVVPPSVVRATAPATWSLSTARLPVAQQSSAVVQESEVAPVMPAGSGPSTVQPATAESAASATAPPAVDPTARQPPPGLQSSAVMSRTVAGTGSSTQLVPPSSVPRATACPSDVWASCPTAVHRRLVVQSMRDR
jgi:hypothetical protein